MIEKLTIQNFLSFKDKTEFDFVASSERPKEGFEFVHWFEEVRKKKILKVNFLFGNNGTGKSNFLSAIACLSDIICNKRTSKTAEDNKIGETYFKLSAETKGKPSLISVEFHTKGEKYRYSIRFCNDVILDEQLEKINSQKKASTIYIRQFNYEKDIVEVTNYAKSIPSSTQEIICSNVIKNTSVISIYDGKNMESEDIRNVYYYFRKIVYIDKLESLSLPQMFENRRNKDELKNVVLQLLGDLGSNIVDYKVDRIETKLDDKLLLIYKTILGEEALQKEYPDGVTKNITVQFAHLTDIEGEYAWLQEHEESLGTLNMIKLIIILYDAIKHHSPIIIDECASGIHQQTFGRIMQFYLATSTETQAFLASQYLPIMEMEGFRRDTLKFFDKERKTGISTCQKVNLRKYHKNVSISRAYLDNAFGSLPEFPTKEQWVDKLHNYKKLFIAENNSL